MRLSRRMFLAGLAASAGCGASGGVIRLPRLANGGDGSSVPRSAAVARAAAPVRRAVDVHCHIFNARDINLDAFVRAQAGEHRLPAGLRDTLRQVTAKLHRAVYAATPPPGGARSLAGLDRSTLEQLQKLLEKTGLGGYDDIERAITAVLTTQESVFHLMEKSFDEVEIFVPAMVDFDGWMPVNPYLPQPGTTSIWTQYGIMRDLAERSAKREFASYVLPIIPFNPRRQVFENNALALVSKAIENGFVGVKLYPPVGFLPTGNAQMPEHQHDKVHYDGKQMWLGEALDRALDQLYAYCEKNDVPIMAHANRSNGFSEDSAWCASAWGWSDVLKSHSGLRLNLAHFGHMEGAGHWDPGEPSDTCIMWAKHIAYLMERYNVFADVGNSELAFDPLYAGRYLAFLQEVLLPTSAHVARRMMYGSDFWMNVVHKDWADYYERVQERLVAQVTSIENWPDYFNRANALCFLGLCDEAGKPRTDAAAYRRALSFHKAHGNGQLPAWLTAGAAG